MLVDLLCRCSKSWLINEISEPAINISQYYLGRDLTKFEYADAVAKKYSIKFVTDRRLRYQLITMLKQSEAKYLSDRILPSEIDEQDVWSFLEMYFYDNHGLDILSDYLGLKDEFLSSLSSYHQTKDVLLTSPSYALYPYQRKIIKSVIKYIHQGDNDRLLIHLPTGSGKTRTAMSIACSHLNENEDGLVIWLADTEELCAQAVAEFNKAWSSLGNREISIYPYFSDSERTLTSVKTGIVVAGLQRLNLRINGKEEKAFEELLQYASLVIFDEAHKAIAKTYKETVNRFMLEGRRTFLIGLSATPGRKFDDEYEDRKLAEFFNEQKVTMEVDGYSSPIQYLIDEKYLAEPEYLPIDYDGSKDLEFTEKEIKEELSKLLNNLSINKSRNSAIIKQAITEYNKDSSIIIFACNVEHATALAETLHCLGYPAASLTSSDDSKESRRYKIEAFKQRKLKIMINFGILTTGFDAPCTNVAIIARPTLSLVLYSQMAGRAMRGKRSGGNERCKIYTVLDNIPEFTSLGKAFGHWNSNWNELR